MINHMIPLTPEIIQRESSECGLACLAMVATGLGRPTSLESLRRLTAISLRGMNAAQILRSASCAGLVGRVIRADLDELERVRLPAILHWRFSHFVVLVSCEKRAYTIHDPARGRQTLTREGLSEAFTGIAMEFSVDAAATGPIQTVQLEKYVSLRMLALGKWRLLAEILMVGLAVEFVNILLPVLLHIIVDDSSSGASLSSVIFGSFAYLLLVAGQFIVSRIRTALTLYFVGSTQVEWSNALFRHLLRLPMEYFNRRAAADIMARYGATRVIMRTLTSLTVDSIIDGAMLFVVLLMMLFYSVQLSAITMVTAAILVLSKWIAYKKNVRHTQEYVETDAAQQGVLLESVRGIQAVKLFMLSPLRLSDWANRASGLAAADFARQRNYLFTVQMSRAILHVDRIASLAFAATFYLGSYMTVGALFAYFAFKEQFLARLSAVVDRVYDALSIRFDVERLTDISTATPEAIPEEPRPVPLDAAFSIALNNVDYRYGDHEPWILKDCSFEVAAGASVAIMGPSGEGKSTLARLMAGLLTPHSGDVLLAGVSLRALDPAEYRQRIACVMQDDKLFSGSVRENISLFAASGGDFDEARMIWAAKAANIYEDIEKMPMRFETAVGESGDGLSGGQKQRICIARALYVRPSLLIMDEATSHLDIQNESAVSQRIKELGITRIIIAHRPETIATADEVFSLQRGKLERVR